MKNSLKKFTNRDFVIILILAVLWAAIAYLMENIFTFRSYSVSLLIAVTLMSFGVHLIKKIGVATAIYAIGAILTLGIGDIAVSGINKLITLLIAGVIFDISLLILKKDGVHTDMDVIVCAAISSAAIPIIGILLLSFEILTTMGTSIANVVLLSLLVGIVGSTLSYIVWHFFRTTGTSLRYELED